MFPAMIHGSRVYGVSRWLSPSGDWALFAEFRLIYLYAIHSQIPLFT
jgi:hypothetical protein